MAVDPELAAAAERMRRDWDERAGSDALRAIYTRDGEADEPDFAASGRANYAQLVRPFLPALLEGRSARACRVLEIGCGVGRMTACFAEAFGEVHGVDVSPRMLALAKQYLAGCRNVEWHLGSGYGLEFSPDAAFDLVFSYIVFQHIPSRPAIERYVREAARVLRPGGAFKFQVNGDQSPDYRAHTPDTWMGQTFSYEQVASMLDGAGLSLLSAEGAGTQYFVVTARKGPPVSFPGLRPYILAGQPWAEAQLLGGWGEAVEQSWRPMTGAAGARLAARGSHFYAGLYLWPEAVAIPRELGISIDGTRAGSAMLAGPGDHYVELSLPVATVPERKVSLSIEPWPLRAPAVRCLGFYDPA